MTEDHTADAEAVEIKLDPAKLMGFEGIAALGEDEAGLRRALEDTHTKIGETGQVSDRRLKTDIAFKGESAGLSLYEFRYAGDDRVMLGVMAQDLLANEARASAVTVSEDGYYRVDYGAIGLAHLVTAEMRDAGAKALAEAARR